jgi:hypothetical protein
MCVSKNAEFYDDFKFVDTGFKNAPQRLKYKYYANFELVCFCPFFQGFSPQIFVNFLRDHIGTFSKL